jgi:hypothetical protein
VLLDRQRNLVAANSAALVFAEDMPDDLLEAPSNIYRTAFSPQGLAARIENFEEFSASVLRRLQRRVAITGERDIAALEQELRSLLPDGERQDEPIPADAEHDAGLPLVLRSRKGRLTFLTTVTMVGTALDMPLVDVVLVAFLPGTGQPARHSTSTPVSGRARPRPPGWTTPATTITTTGTSACASRASW